jgi:hypothetical protein
MATRRSLGSHRRMGNGEMVRLDAVGALILGGEGASIRTDARSEEAGPVRSSGVGDPAVGVSRGYRGP